MLVSQTVVYFYSPLLQIFCLIEEFQMRKDIFIEKQKRVDFTLKMNIWHLVKNIISPFSRCLEMSCFRFGRERFISLSFKAKSVGNMSNPSCPDHVPEILQWGTPVFGVHAGTSRYALKRVGTSGFSVSDVGICRGAASACHAEEDRSTEFSLPYLQVWAAGWALGREWLFCCTEQLVARWAQQVKTAL